MYMSGRESRTKSSKSKSQYHNIENSIYQFKQSKLDLKGESKNQNVKIAGDV